MIGLERAQQNRRHSFPLKIDQGIIPGSEEEDAQLVTGSHNNNIAGKVNQTINAIENNDPNVRNVNMSSNSLGNVEATRLAKALGNNTNVIGLNLENNNITNIGAKALATALHKNSSISWINVRSNNIGREGMADLARAWKQSSTLKWLIPESYLGKPLRDLLSTPLSSGGMGEQKEEEEFTSPSLSVDEDDWQQLAYAGIGVGSVHLRPFGSNDGPGDVKNMVAGGSVDIDDDESSKKGAGSAHQSNSHRANLSSTRKWWRIKVSAWIQFRLRLRCKTTYQVINRIKKNDPEMKEADLSFKKVGNAGAKKLAAAIQGNTNLDKLCLQSSGIGDKGTAELARALRHNSTLACLDLRCNRIGTNGANTLLAEALCHNSTVVSVDLEGNRIDEHHASKIAGLLAAGRPRSGWKVQRGATQL